MKKTISTLFILITFLILKNTSCSIVEIHNNSPFKIETNFDLMAYPDTKKTISENSTHKENIGTVFLRGISVGLHIGNNFEENILSENLSQTLGFGDIQYHIFAELKNDGRKNSAGEFIVEFVLYLVRSPKSIFYRGGCIAKSKIFKVATRDFENFTLVKNDEKQSCNSTLINLLSNNSAVGYSSTSNR